MAISQSLDIRPFEGVCTLIIGNLKLIRKRNQKLDLRAK